MCRKYCKSKNGKKEQNEEEEKVKKNHSNVNGVISKGNYVWNNTQHTAEV